MPYMGLKMALATAAFFAIAWCWRQVAARLKRGMRLGHEEGCSRFADKGPDRPRLVLAPGGGAIEKGYATRARKGI